MKSPQDRKTCPKSYGFRCTRSSPSPHGVHRARKRDQQNADSRSEIGEIRTMAGEQRGRLNPDPACIASLRRPQSTPKGISDNRMRTSATDDHGDFIQRSETECTFGSRVNCRSGERGNSNISWVALWPTRKATRLGAAPRPTQHSDVAKIKSTSPAYPGEDRDPCIIDSPSPLEQPVCRAPA